MRRVTAIACLSLAASSWGCSGTLETTEPGGSTPINGVSNAGTGAGGLGSTAAATAGAGGATAVGGAGQLPPEVTGEQFSSPSLRRLTVVQYQNSLRALFGDSVTLPALEPDTTLNGLKAIATSTIAMSSRATELFETAARDVAAQIFTDTAARDALVGCAPTEQACLEGFIGSFGRRAWRRPLSSEEIAKYVSLTQTNTTKSGDAWLGLSLTVSGLLQSPNFLYRVEIGLPDPNQAARHVLNSFEVASRLSYLLWSSPPDDALLDAAQTGSLLDVNAIAVEAQRLLADPRAVLAVENFFAEYLGLDRLEATQKLPAAFPSFTTTLRDAMRQESLLSLRTLSFDEGADFRTLLTTRTTFVNTELAALYGIADPGGTAFSRVSLPTDGARVGLLGQASLMTLHSHASTSSPTVRGKFVREILLCQSVPAPPPNVNTTLPDTQGAVTMREKLALHASGPTCSTCHKMMDPIGLALENFDGVGAYRATENGAPIDASGELDGVTYTNAEGLAQAISNHARFPECVARTLYRYSFGHLETPAEVPAITSLVTTFSASGFKLRDLLLATTQLPGFRYAGALD